MNNHGTFTRYLMLTMFCLVNLIYMHYYIFCTCDIEADYEATSFFDNICGCIFDLCVLFIFFFLLTRKRLRPTLAFCYSVTLTWSFCNILYSRFFFRYLSFSAFGQTSNLFDWLLIESMLAEIQRADIFYIVSPIVFWFVYKKTPLVACSWNILLQTAMVMFLFFVVSIAGHTIYCLANPSLRYFSYYRYRLYFTHIDTSRNAGRPNWTNYHRGTIRTMASDISSFYQATAELSLEQANAVKNEINTTTGKAVPHTANPQIKNIIFILVESYTAFTTDMKIDGKEVTPFLNKLRHEPDVFYNGKMKSNITIGQSSDGQYIYLSGLLPLRSIITVTKAKDRTIISLPKVLKQFNKDLESRMIIPTLPSLWEQDSMCQAYGFDQLYSSNDYKNSNERNLNDEQVFELAKEADLKSTRPFFSFILTLSMHGPYNKQIDDTFVIKDKKYCSQLINFLNVCHYTDRQIEKYFTHLKQQHLYENSLIIIAPDHQVPENTVNTEQYGITRNLPLFIINGHIDPQQAWTGQCNQLDVFTTILNTLGVNCAWKGLGNTLLNPNYTNSLKDNKWDISEWILLSDFFKKQKQL